VRALISKVLTGSMIASAGLAVREGDEMQVFIHPCGKREAISRNAVKLPCAACRAMTTAPASLRLHQGEG
jgi:hypothetical protein